MPPVDPAEAPRNMHIKIVRHPTQGIGIFVDDHNFFVFTGQMAGDLKADLTRTDDDDLQWIDPQGTEGY